MQTYLYRMIILKPPKIIQKIRFNDFDFTFSFTEEFDHKHDDKYIAYFDASQLTNLKVRQWRSVQNNNSTDFQNQLANITWIYFSLRAKEFTK